MSVILRVGGGAYAFPDDAVTIDRSVSVVLSPQKVPEAEVHVWNCTVNFAGDGLAEVLAAGRAAELALGRQYQDLSFESGSTVIYALPNSTATNGVLITNIRNTPAAGHLATAYYLSFEATATYPLASQAGQVVILELRESVRYAGGLPEYGFTECVNADPQKFLIKKRRVGHAEQSGSMRTLGNYGTYPDPLWPGDLMDEQTQDDKGRNSDGVEEFSIAWTYIFAASRAFR